MITYRSETASLVPEDLAPFFEGWPTAPAPDRRLAAIRGADHAVLAYDDDRLVGFVTALTDDALVADVTLLEVVPSQSPPLDRLGARPEPGRAFRSPLRRGSVLRRGPRPVLRTPRLRARRRDGAASPRPAAVIAA